MSKKSAIQVLMIALIFIIFTIFYLKYFNKNFDRSEKNIVPTKVNISKNTSANYIDDINYISSSMDGNKYQITAKQGEIDFNNPDIMFLKNIVAYIFVKDSDTIKITSNFGKYNSKNYDTIFSKNVIVIYPGHKITGDYLDFSFLNNLGTISTDVVYTGNKTSLVADKIEMNITTKDTKIFMHENKKKVFIESTK